MVIFFLVQGIRKNNQLNDLLTNSVRTQSMKSKSERNVLKVGPKSVLNFEMGSPVAVHDFSVSLALFVCAKIR